jgi:hypothetical protein
VSHGDPALDALPSDAPGVFGPESFRDYLERTGADPSDYRTAGEISIDTRRQLDDRLRAAETTVLRLGRAPDGSGTQFALVHVPRRLDDFYLDESTFEADDRRVFDYRPDGADRSELSATATDALEVYRALPTLSETSIVDLGLSTQILPWALDLADEDGAATTAASVTTVQSTFAFSFDPHPACGATLRHRDGQVEVDAVVPARRDDDRLFVVIEAKRGRPRALAKHKLLYPALAAAGWAPDRFDRVVPVFLRARRDDEGLNYSVYECSSVPTADDEMVCLAALTVERDRHCRVLL